MATWLSSQPAALKRVELALARRASGEARSACCAMDQTRSASAFQPFIFAVLVMRGRDCRFEKVQPAVEAGGWPGLKKARRALAGRSP